MIKTSDFPYPVLRSDQSVLTSYKREFHIKIECGEPVNNENDYVFKIQVSTNSNTIEKMIKENKASVYISYQINILKKTFKINNKDMNYELRIPYSFFQSIDELVISAVITANNDFELIYNDEMDEGYNLEVPYYITKKDILAISNEIIFDFNKSGKTIIKLIKRDDLEFGFQVNINQDDYILIEISPTFKKSYNVIAQKQSELKISALTMINSSLINLAMINVFMRLIIEGFENHKDKRWFKIIRATFNKKGINMEDIMTELKDEPDINKVYELVDIFLNHFLDKVIYKCSEELK